METLRNQYRALRESSSLNASEFDYLAQCIAAKATPTPWGWVAAAAVVAVMFPREEVEALEQFQAELAWQF